MLAPSLLLALAIAMPQPPSTDGAMAPRLTVGDDRLWLSWLEPAEGEATKGGVSVVMRAASFDGKVWSAAETVVARPDAFANWADVPSVVESKDGDLYAHWLQKSAGGKYAYDVQLARRRGRDKWRPLGRLHNDGVAAEHGFVSAVPLSRGVRYFWLDGRRTASKGAMTLRSARVTRRGVRDNVLVDDQVCDCCATAAAAVPAGARVVYRDRRPGEIRDVSTAVVRGKKVSSRNLVHEDGWNIPGCPVNGPALDARGGRTVAAWFTQGGDGTARVRAAFLDANGVAAAPIAVEEGNTLGRVDVVLTEQSAIVVSLAQRGERADVQLRRVTEAGHAGETLLVGETSSARNAGFPQLERLGDTLVLVWTEVTGDVTTLRAAQLKASAVPAALAAPPADSPLAAATPRSLPVLALTDLVGKPAALRSGKTTIVHLWATWCAPCLEEMPGLLLVARELERSGAQLVFVSVDQPGQRDAVAKLAAQWGAEDIVRLDPRQQAEPALAAKVMPSTYVFGPDGALRWSASGKAPLDALRTAAAP